MADVVEFLTLQLRSDAAQVRCTITRGLEVVTAEYTLDAGPDCQTARQIQAAQAAGLDTGLLENRLARLKAQRLARAQQGAEIAAKRLLATAVGGATRVR